MALNQLKMLLSYRSILYGPCVTWAWKLSWTFLLELLVASPSNSCTHASPSIHQKYIYAHSNITSVVYAHAMLKSPYKRAFAPDRARIPAPNIHTCTSAARHIDLELTLRERTRRFGWGKKSERYRSFPGKNRRRPREKLPRSPSHDQEMAHGSGKGDRRNIFVLQTATS